MSDIEQLTVTMFIDWLDINAKSLLEYRIYDAEYDDVFYDNIPLAEFEKLNITIDILDKIYANTSPYEGSIRVYDNNTVTIIGGA